MKKQTNNIQILGYFLAFFVIFYLVLVNFIAISERKNMISDTKIETEVTVVNKESLREVNVEGELKLTEDIVVYSENGERFHELHFRDISKNTMYVSVISEDRVNRLKDELIK